RALDRAPGGSSGGSAAAVAARMAPVALGSDTGGSIRQPASFCGIVGLRPTYGRVSRYGLLAFASSLDQIGPLTLTVGDAALTLNVIAGADAADATSAPDEVPDYTAALDGDVRSATIGVPSRMLESGVDADVARAFRAALDVLTARGATLVDVELPHAKHAIAVYYLVATAEASSNLARYDGVRYGFRAPDSPAKAGPHPDALPSTDALRSMYARTRAGGFGPEVKRRIMLGTYVLSAGYYDAYYLKAQQVRTLILRDYDRAFERVDVVAMPTSPTTAFPIGERAADPLQMYLADVFTVSANLAGLPAISVPCGFSAGLPVGFPGIAIPFYLAHPRLAKLELAQMLEVEGGDAESCLRILRHEAGHAIDNGYLLRRRPRRRKLFGSPTVEYPEYYTPKPYSKRFVQHLDHWYGQRLP